MASWLPQVRHLQESRPSAYGHSHLIYIFILHSNRVGGLPRFGYPWVFGSQEAVLCSTAASYEDGKGDSSHRVTQHTPINLLEAGLVFGFLFLLVFFGFRACFTL
jgi:hypothetical protein